MTDSFHFADVEVDPVRFQVLRGGVALELEPRAVHVLLYLMRNPGRLVSKEEIFAAVWGETFVTDNALARIIAQLRKALGDSSRQPRYIETVPTLGYRFIASLGNGTPRGAEPRKPGPRKSGLAAAAAMLVVAGAFMAWKLVKERAPAAAPPSARQLTTGAGLDAGGDFSPDGSSFTYASDRSGQFEIYTQVLAGEGKEFQVTRDGGQNIHPRWSPDGSLIAYESAARGGIWVVSPLGGQPRQISTFGARPDWSPDGRWIVFRSHEMHSFAPEDNVPVEPTALWLAAATGGPPRQLTKPLEPPCYHSDPTFFPNSREVLFVCFTRLGLAAPSNLYRVSIDTGRYSPLPQPAHFVLTPRFSRDGGRLFYAGADRSASFAVWELPANDFSAEPRSLRATGFRIPRDIAIAPNGNLLAYAEMETQSALWYVPLHAPTGLPAGRPLPLTRQSLRRASLPVFSPDGALIAYSQRRAGTSADIHIMNADGTEERAVTFGPSHDGLASWNPDGSAIVFNSESEKSRRLVQISLNGRTESVLPFPLGEQRLARLSPDGQRVASHQFNAGTVSTWITQLDGSRPIRLAPSVPSAGFPVWSPDGARLAVEVFRGNSTALGIVSAADPAADARLLIDQPGQHWPWSWDPAGRRIALATRENGRWALEWISVSSGARQTFASEQSLRLFLRYPAWSPRGDRIVYERSETRGNIHLLTLLQPGPPAQPPSNSPAGRFPVPGSAPAGTRRYP